MNKNHRNDLSTTRMKDFSEFEKKIGVDFNDKDLLEQAFTHRSYLNENQDIRHGHNERLEFLGDAVMELVITDYLFKKFPDVSEGELTAYRSALVRTETISHAALELGAGDFLLLSKGEARDGGKARDYILANTFESIIGAIYLDHGYATAEIFISSTLYPRIEDIVKNGSWKDPKSFIQEKAQEEFSVTPEYRVHSELGPDHDKNFVVGIYFGEELVAVGEGKSKQQAQQEAAIAARYVKEW